MCAALVWSIAAPNPGVVVVFSCLGVILLESAHRRVTGFSAYRPAGPRSSALLVGQIAVLVTMAIASWVLVATDRDGWVTVLALAAFVIMLVTGLWYERVHAAEVRRACE